MAVAVRVGVRTSTLCLKITENIVKNFKINQHFYVPSVCMSSHKHFDMKFKKQRREKKFWFDREKFFSDKDLTQDEQRIEFKKQGKQMPRLDRRSSPRMENVLSLNESGGLYEQTVPRTGEGRLSPLSSEGLKYYKEAPFRKIADFRSRRTLKKYEDGFNRKELANECQLLFIKAMNLLTTKDIRKNIDELAECMTGYCIRTLTEDFAKRTVEWEFIETVKPPKIVQMRTREVTVKDNLITQITVKIHSKQKLAVYDQFGRLMLGSPNNIKTVIEYLVFENHIVDTYGKWRLHGKIKPSWEPAQPIIKTMTRADLEKIDEIIKETGENEKDEIG